MMQHTIMAVFDTARHAQIAVDDLLVCDIPSESIHQYRLAMGADPDAAIRPENEFHRPSGAWTWLINDHPPPAERRAQQEALYQESRQRNEPVVVTIDNSTLTNARIIKILGDHAPLEVRGNKEGWTHADTSFAQENKMDPSEFDPQTPVEMTEYH
ncbi:hypothetical protein C0V97_02315 [Asaia sp. W19]|uniref:hypothetical protein n=1 Tax=unclassified Asaia TaxID=2685023 RepID=UPI000F8E0E26|nr:hypothetical protein [Asaia sp. W19]RUT27075.1 hypothetical protein C0V97_02315 [Asaia sp. W19]